jgi:hypothetical protein
MALLILRNSAMRNALHFTVFGLLALCLASCATGRQHINTDQPVQPKPSAVPMMTIYGVGDAGENDAQSGAVIRHLAGEAMADQQPGAIIFLGDNVYPEGLEAPGHPDHENGIALLNKQIGLLAGYDNAVLFIPGNHDWKEGRPGGLESIQRQSDFINQHGAPNLKFRPANGCGDPTFLSPVPGIQIVIIDSQWWIQDWSREAEMNAGCEVKSRDELIQRIKARLADHPDDQVVMVMHHPLETQGPHGGNYTFRDHMFPLSKVVKWLYVPLPVIGSIYPWYRTVLGHPQDLKNSRYKSLQTAIYAMLQDREEVIYLAGHDHSLQYIAKEGRHVVISGSGSKQNAIADNLALLYGHKAPGYVVLDFYEDKSVWLRINEVDPETGRGETVFHRQIISK